MVKATTIPRKISDQHLFAISDRNAYTSVKLIGLTTVNNKNNKPKQLGKQTDKQR